MIQTASFWQRPYWQRLAIGIGLMPVVVVLMVAEFLMAVVTGIVGLLRDIGKDAAKHVVHLYYFYRCDVFSPDPKKHQPAPDPDYWEAQ